MPEINIAFFEVFENNQEPVELVTLTSYEEPSYKKGDIISLPEADFVSESETINTQDAKYEIVIASPPDTVSANYTVIVKNYIYYLKKV